MDAQITKWRDEREYDRIISIITARIQSSFGKHGGDSKAVYEDIIEGLSIGIMAQHIIGDVFSVYSLAIQLAHVYHLFSDRNQIRESFEVIYE